MAEEIATHNRLMYRRIRLMVSVLFTFFSLSLVWPVHAWTLSIPAYESSTFDLVNAVNALRAAYGLPPYSINSTLMFTAQNQADFMAATGNVTHSGPGGATLTDRILAAGYPLGGDLSLGGFRAENITAGGAGLTAQEAVEAWMGDAPHQNTMLSPDLTEIGAGVAVMNGRVYYVIDCARPANGASLSVSTVAVGSGTTVPAKDAPISAVVLSTPNVNGDVIHEVQYGQTLWQLAISYGVKIDEIKRLNDLFGNDIYPGERLLIKKEGTSTPLPSTETATPPADATSTFLPSATATSFSPTMAVAVTPVIPPVEKPSQARTTAVIIIVMALLFGGLFTWLARVKKRD